MIEEFIPRLQKELELEGGAPREQGGNFSLQLDDTSITISDAGPGFQFFAALGDLPGELPELFYIKLLRGNFLHQATSGATVGLDETASKLVLQYYYPQKSPYRDFKERLEDFINLIDFWKAEIAAHKAAPAAS